MMSGELPRASTTTGPPEVHDSGGDIYRGEPPSPVEHRSLGPSGRSHSLRSSTSSSSSSSLSFFSGGRLGAIANVVEHAISRWARGSSSSSSSSSSSTSTSSISSNARSRRRRRRHSFGNLRSTSEADIHARISLIKAREESRQIPRLMGLYLPKSLLPKGATEHFNPADPMFWTSSLSLLLARLERALRTFTKARRYIDRQQNWTPEASTAVTPPLTTSRTPTPKAAKGRKGKQKETLVSPSLGRVTLPEPWFLDVASPTWHDMREIGKILHLHPLTLEDIVQQEPREKVELFPNLGYYFIAFRAIASQQSLGTNIFQGDRDVEDIAEANVYMVVFTEGLCVFHFTDISAHTDRVRNRIMSRDKDTPMSADWLAHILLDSIVDSFFPWLEEIEKELVALEDIVFSSVNVSENPEPTQNFISSDETLVDAEKTSSTDLPSKLTEKNVHLLEKRTAQTHFKTQGIPLRLFLRRCRRFLTSRWRTAQSLIAGQPSQPSATHMTLRRMARTRRLVTSLSRLLATKSEVVTRVQKRLLTSAHPGFGQVRSENLEVAIYLGDVEDHILTLQNSLQHFERMLSRSHPTYIAQIRTSVTLTKGDTDRALIVLTVVSIGCLSGQCTLSLFSMNVTVPHNEVDPDVPSTLKKFNVFGIVITLVLMVITTYLCVVRRWWQKAKRRRDAQL